MRIRFFNTFEPVTTFYRDLLPMLADSGMQAEVYISVAEYRHGRTSLSSVLKHPNLHIRYLPSCGISAKGRIQKTFLMLLYMLSAALTSLFSSPFDINFFLTQPPFFSLWGWVLKALRGQRYMCLVMDIYPDVAVQDGFLRHGSLVVRMFSSLNLFIWKHADAVIVIGRCMQEQLLRSGVTAEKIHFIPNWANEEIIFPVPIEQNPLKSEYGLQNSFVILYSGNMGISHEFQTLLDAAEYLLPEKTIQFLLIGDGGRRIVLEKQAGYKKLENIIFLPFQPLERLAESLSLGDVHLVTLRAGFEGLVVPSKAYSALSVGCPLIYVGKPESEIARMVIDEEIGVVVASGDGVGLAKAILNYFHDEGYRSTHGQKALSLSRGRYSRKSAISAYLNLIRET